MCVCVCDVLFRACEVQKKKDKSMTNNHYFRLKLLRTKRH